ncbi:MAG: cell division protein ZapA [Gemmatimonadota bacterium]
MKDSEKAVVTVTIAGDEYTIRADATPDHTRECAAYVDRTVQEILAQSALVQPQKAVILAALALADQLLRTRAEAQAERQGMERLTVRLADDVAARLAGDTD